MNNEELRQFYKEIDDLKREHKSFKRRVSILANLFVPGIGFILYGSSFLKGIFLFILFLSYNLLFIYKIMPNIDWGVGIIFYTPAIVIWAVSIVLVAGLDD